MTHNYYKYCESIIIFKLKYIVDYFFIKLQKSISNNKNYL